MLNTRGFTQKTKIYTWKNIMKSLHTDAAEEYLMPSGNIRVTKLKKYILLILISMQIYEADLIKQREECGM